MINNCITFKCYQLEKNYGHGIARKISFDKTSTDYVALMDADDISYPNRFSSQMVLFNDHSIDVVGGQISEFDDDERNIFAYRNTFTEDYAIKQDLKKRCPINLVTAIFKKSSYYSSGGFKDFFCNEDYDLWIRMFQCGFHFRNSQNLCVNVRASKRSVKRRSGIKYFKSEAKIQKLLLKNRIISFPRYFLNIIKRFVGELIIGKIAPSIFFKLAHRNSNIYEEKMINLEDITNKIFSVAMCVYAGDDPIFFKKSIESIINQTLKPREIILVIDGYVSDDMLAVINQFFGKVEQINGY